MKNWSFELTETKIFIILAAIAIAIAVAICILIIDGISGTEMQIILSTQVKDMTVGHICGLIVLASILFKR